MLINPEAGYAGDIHFVDAVEQVDHPNRRFFVTQIDQIAAGKPLLIDIYNFSKGRFIEEQDVRLDLDAWPVSRVILSGLRLVSVHACPCL